MDSKNVEVFPETSSPQVFEIPGETAIVINGMPPMSSIDSDLVPCPITDSWSAQLSCFGDWLVGREVQKLFADQFFKGTVMQFAEEMGWYQVTYEDGDFEDLELHELLEILTPLDVDIPLKGLYVNIIKKRRSSQRSAKSKAKSFKRSKFLWWQRRENGRWCFLCIGIFNCTHSLHAF